jgi:hypothetical protein
MIAPEESELHKTSREQAVTSNIHRILNKLEVTGRLEMTLDGYHCRLIDQS